MSATAFVWPLPFCLTNMDLKLWLALLSGSLRHASPPTTSRNKLLRILLKNKLERQRK
jgi:hypothetical protein